MTLLIIAVVLVDFAFQFYVYRRRKREHREFMAEMHRKWCEKFPVEYPRTQITVTESRPPGWPLTPPTRSEEKP